MLIIVLFIWLNVPHHLPRHQLQVSVFLFDILIFKDIFNL